MQLYDVGTNEFWGRGDERKSTLTMQHSIKPLRTASFVPSFSAGPFFCLLVSPSAIFLLTITVCSDQCLINVCTVKVIVIVGGTSGLGLSAAQACVAAGDHRGRGRSQPTGMRCGGVRVGGPCAGC